MDSKRLLRERTPVIPFDPVEHSSLVMLRLTPLLEQERSLLPKEVAVRWGIDELGAQAPIRCEFADDLDADGQLWMRVLIDGTGESWFAIDSRAVGIYDAGGELFVVPAMADEVA